MRRNRSADARAARAAQDARAVRGVLIEALRNAFDQRSWHGATLLGSIRSVRATTASRAIGRRRTIWQQVLHTAYWKHVVCNKLAGTTRFPRRGSNWPAIPADPTEAAWRADVTLLKQTHARLVDLVATLPDDRLVEDDKTRWLIHGAAAHDLYHAGQIKLLRRFIDDLREKRD